MIEGAAALKVGDPVVLVRQTRRYRGGGVTAVELEVNTDAIVTKVGREYIYVTSGRNGDRFHKRSFGRPTVSEDRYSWSPYTPQQWEARPRAEEAVERLRRNGLVMTQLDVGEAIEIDAFMAQLRRKEYK